MSAVWARNWYGWSWSLLERGRDPLGRLVEVMGVLVVERRGHVLPVVVECRREVLLAGDDHGGVGRREVEEGAEVLERGDLSQLAVLLGELRCRRHLDQLRVSERALGEGREPAQRLDLIAEQVDPDGAVLGGGVEVEQATADRELTTVLDLVDTLIPGRDEVPRGLVEIKQIAGAER